MDITADEGVDEEVVEARGYYSSTWRRPDRTMRLRAATSAIHYKGPNGFLLIDPTVVELDSQPEPFEPEVASETAPAIPFSVDPQKTAPGETEAPTVAAPATTAPTAGPQLTGAPGLVETDYSLANETNLLQTYFADDRAQVRADGITASIIYAPAQIRYVDGTQQDVVANAGPSTPLNFGNNTVTYPNVFKNVSVEYETKPAGISQKFIFSEAPRAPAGDMDLENLTISIGETIQLSESAILRSADGQPITGNTGTSSTLKITGPGGDMLIIPTPEAFDNKGANNSDAMILPEAGTYTIEDNGNGTITLWTNISYKWFSDAAREYPITVDPEIIVQPAEGASKDSLLLDNVGVGGGAPDPFWDFVNDQNRGTYPFLMQWFITVFPISPANSPFACYGIIQFPEIENDGEIPVGSTVNSAQLTLFHAFNGHNPLEMVNNLAAWDEATVTTNNAPAFNPVPLSTFDPTIVAQEFVFEVWDVTTFVTLTVAGIPDHQFGWRIQRSDGINTRPLNFVGPGSTIQYYSSTIGNATQRPELIVDYTPPPPVINCALVPLCIDPCAGPCVYQVQMDGFDPFPQGDQDINVLGSIDLGLFAFNMDNNDFLVIKLAGGGPPKVGFKHGVPSVTAQEVCLTCTGTSSFSGITVTETDCLPPCGDDDDDDD